MDEHADPDQLSHSIFDFVREAARNEAYDLIGLLVQRLTSLE